MGGEVISVFEIELVLAGAFDWKRECEAGCFGAAGDIARELFIEQHTRRDLRRSRDLNASSSPS
jgi:hypothetical protein